MASDLSAQVVTELRVALRRMVERATRWLLASRRAPLDIVAAAAQFTEGVREVRAGLGALPSAAREPSPRRCPRGAEGAWKLSRFKCFFLCFGMVFARFLMQLVPVS